MPAPSTASGSKPGEEVRGASLFILEDLGQLTGNRPAQQELLHALDVLADRGAAVVVTARVLPTHWSVLLPALRSRLSAGLAVQLALPGRAARRAILERLIVRARHGPAQARCAQSGRAHEWSAVRP